MKYFSTARIKKLPVICNIPHGSIKIPQKFKKDFIISDQEFAKEAKRMADLYSEDFYSGLLKEYGGIIFNLSRIVMDVERLENDKNEIMSKKGMGVLYTKTETGKAARILNNSSRRTYLNEIYHPYQDFLTKMVSECLSKFGKCLILDCHTFPSAPRPYELDQVKSRPDFCLGTDNFHTPEKLKKILSKNLKNKGFSLKYNSPFSGTIIPMSFYRKNKNVFSIMIETNRRLYMNEGRLIKKDNFDKISKLVCQIIKNSCRAFLERI